jgi:hypothetical protein
LRSREVYRDHLATCRMLNIPIRGNSFGIVNRLWAGQQTKRGSIPGRINIFLSLHRPDPLLGPPSLSSNGYRGVGGAVADSSPSSAGVKNTWSYTYTSTSPYFIRRGAQLRTGTPLYFYYFITYIIHWRSSPCRA